MCLVFNKTFNILIKEVLPEQIIFMSGWDEEKNKIRKKYNLDFKREFLS
jgi:hypothetical protein